MITRQVVGNLKESLLPYAKKQLKLAKMSFDLFGALSPSSSCSQRLLGTMEHHKKTDDDNNSDGAEGGDPGGGVGGDGGGGEENGGGGARTVGQVEVEGSTPKV